MGKALVYQGIVLLLVFLFSCEHTQQEESSDSGNKTEDTLNKNNASDTSVRRITAKDYNNALINYQRMSIEQVKRVYGQPFKKIDKNLSEVIFELKIYKEDVKAMKKTDFEHGSKFAQAMTDLIEFYIKQLDQKLKKIVETSSSTKATGKALSAYKQQFIDKEEQYFDAVFSAQDDFADYHNIELVPQKDSLKN